MCICNCHLWFFIVTSILPFFQCLNYLEPLSTNINSCCPIYTGLSEFILIPQLIFLIVAILHLYPFLQSFNPMYFIYLSTDSLYYLKEIMIFQNEFSYLLQLTTFELFPFSKPFFPSIFLLFSLQTKLYTQTSHLSQVRTLTP